MHTILPHLLRRTVKVAVVGCAEQGVPVISGLPHFTRRSLRMDTHQACL